MSPGFRGFAAGVKHAMLADNVLNIIGVYPNKKQKMAPVSKNYRKGTRGKKTIYKKKESPKTMVKKALLSMAQTYHDTVGDNTVNAALTHNTIYTYNITAQCTQGTGLDERQGDEIYLVGLKIKGSVFTAATAGAYKYRVMVLLSGEEYNPAVLNSSGLTSGEIWLPNTAFTFNVHGLLNTKAVTPLFDQVLDINSTISGVADVATVDINIPLSRKFQYQSDNGVYGKKQNIYLVVTSNVGGGTAGTTSTGQFLGATDLIYKNL